MYQQPGGSRTVGGFTQAPAAAFSHGPRYNNYNPHLMPNPNVRAMNSVNPYLPPPPSYFSPHLMNSVAGRSEPKFLSNWCVSVNNVRYENGDTGLIAELSGTLLENDGRTVIYENEYAGRIQSIISYNIVKTHIGVYHLVGPISQGYPNNLYRACLEANGIPRTWKYILTQFSGPGYAPRRAPAHVPAPAPLPAPVRARNYEVERMGMGVQELIRSFCLLRNFAIIADRKSKELQKARKPISFVRYRFHEKVVQSLKTVNTQIILGLKTILKHD